MWHFYGRCLVFLKKTDDTKVTLVDDSTKSLPQHGTSHLQTLGGKSPSRFALVVEVLLFIGLAIVLKFLVNQLTLRFSGPISLVMVMVMVMVLVILTFYLRTRGLKRNLWPLVLWHGITNSMSFTVLYLGLE